MGFLMVFHALVCIILVTLVLIQQGKGGGLIEMASGMESIFGTKTSAFLTKTTTILASVYFVSCLVIAVVASRGSHSLMEREGGKTKATAAQSSAPGTKAQQPDVAGTTAQPAAQPAAAVQQTGAEQKPAESPVPAK